MPSLVKVYTVARMLLISLRHASSFFLVMALTRVPSFSMARPKTFMSFCIAVRKASLNSCALRLKFVLSIGMRVLTSACS